MNRIIPRMFHSSKAYSTLAQFLGVRGPDAALDLSEEAWKHVRQGLVRCGYDVPESLSLMGYLMPFLAEAFRLGEQFGIARESNPISALYPPDFPQPKPQKKTRKVTPKGYDPIEIGA